jgi:hypothetical protein
MSGPPFLFPAAYNGGALFGAHSREASRMNFESFNFRGKFYYIDRERLAPIRYCINYQLGVNFLLYKIGISRPPRCVTDIRA